MEVERVRLRLRDPLVTAWGTLTEREIAFVRIGEGIGEAAPLEPYDGVSMGSVLAALDAYAEVLAGDPDDPLEACRAERDLPQALAAIDLALWDGRARAAGCGLCELLGAEPAPIPVNALVGAEDRAGAAAAAAAAVEAGYRCVKVKVGVGDDAGRLAAVRAAVGPDVANRADANGAWGSPREALANLRALAPIGLELCEEPVHGVDALRAVRAESPVPIAMDETYAPRSGAADAVCLKISRCGGITGLLRDAATAKAAGAVVYLSSTFDGPAGISAALHTAAAVRDVLPCGLATLGAFEGIEPLPLVDGGIVPPGMLRA
jgi:L-alanine-DL-glutamate epimerase-like enolase superfamily enzyme